MNEKIEETLRRLAGGMSAGDMPTSGTPETNQPIGDPDCPHCHGQGYVRADVPLGHPNFGRLEICTCRLPAVKAAIRKRLYSLSRLDELKELTFESFNPSGGSGIGERQQASLQSAFDLCQRYAQSLEGWLLLQGPYGCGKTHLAASIANMCVSLGVPTLFLTVPDLLDSLRFTYDSDETSFEDRFDQIRNAPLLVLDDFGTQSATAWAQEKLFQILNYRYINQMPLVITTNLSLEELEGRIRSRLSDPSLVVNVPIQAPDYRRHSEDDGQPELSSLHIHSHQTFGTFNMRKSDHLSTDDQHTLEDAFKAAMEYAEDPDGWMVFMGPYGSGKTHLAASIANYRASQGYPVMFVVVPDLMDHLRATFNPRSTVSYDRRFEEIRSAPLLVLDDLGTESATPWVKEKLYQLFNVRYNAKLPTVITTASTLDEIDPRLRSRLGDRRLVQGFRITAPAYRGSRAKKR